MLDSNFHLLDSNNRLSDDDQSKSMGIGGVCLFVGANVMVLKGMIIGNCSVIESGYVVSGLISDSVIVIRPK